MKSLFFGTLLIALSAQANESAPAAHPPAEKASAPAAPKHEESAAEKLYEKVQCEKLPQKTATDLWNLAECFYKIGVTQLTIDTLRVIAQKNPKDLEAFFTASWLIWQEGQARGGAEERKRTEEALSELEKARLSNPTHWAVDIEIGDFYFLRLNSPEKAYGEYLRARRHYDGDYARNVPKAENGRKAAIEDRLARTAEKLDRKGEAVESSCRALFFDPDDAGALARITRLQGSCVRKKVQDPRKEEKEEGAR